jgi:hypothetical protein
LLATIAGVFVDKYAADTAGQFHLLTKRA